MARRYASASNGSPWESRTNAPATNGRPSSTDFVSARTWSFVVPLMRFTYPVSMFTAGTRPAAAVRSTWAWYAVQSTRPFSWNGSRTADMPVMLRRGRIIESGSTILAIIGSPFQQLRRFHGEICKDTVGPGPLEREQAFEDH